MKRIAAVIIAAVLVLTMFAGCSSKEVSPVALKIGDMEYTVEDVNYLYVATFNELYYDLYYTYSSYGIDISQIIDISKPLEEQTVIGGTETWHEYLLDYTVNTLKSITGIKEEAEKAGFVLPEEYQEDIDTFDTQLVEIAQQNGMTAEEYIESSYGKGISKETVKKMTEIQLFCSAYIEEYRANAEVTEEDISAYYEANRKDIDTVDFRYYSSIYSDEVTEETETEEPTEETETEEPTEETEEIAEEEKTLTKEEAQAQADALAAVHTADEFNALAKEYTLNEEDKKLFDEGDATLFPSATYSSTGIEEVSEWLFDEARQPGDTFVYHDEEYKSFLTIMFEKRVDPSYDLVNVRHILITPEEDEEGNSSDEDWAAAEAKATEVYEGYLAGEQTEEAFSELAKEHSKDGNASTGGIYENVKKGQMVQTFNDWCFDEARKTGDSGIVKTQFGYHIMYFVGFGDNNLESLIKPVIAEERLTVWMTEATAGLTEERTEAFETCGGMIDEIVAEANGNASAETEKETKSFTGIIIGVLVAVIIVCIVIIIKNGGKKKAEPEEMTETEESEESVLEASEEDLTEEELLAEESFEENPSEEEAAEEVSEETEE